MAQIRIENNYSWLQANEDIRQILWRKLRFRAKGAWYSPRVKARQWDGFTEFFKQQTGRFLTGLLPEIRVFLRSAGEPILVSDERKPVLFTPEEIDENFLGNGITLRDFQVDYCNQAIRKQRGVIPAPTGAGKAQPLDSMVATPTGFRRMGDLKVGDHVLVPSGGSAKITHVHPQGNKPIVRVEFNNGDSVECCEDHLWKVNATYDQWKGRVMSTKDMIPRVKCPNGNSRYNISMPENVDFTNQPVPLPPYMMGLLLGDGCFRHGAVIFTSVDQEPIDYLKNQLPEGYSLHRNKRHGYSISGGLDARFKAKNPYVQALESLGLYGKLSHEKFVPECYLVNDRECRLAVLQGLMDTDGTIDKKGKIRFLSTSKRLAENVAWLVHSLGGMAFSGQCQKWFTHNGVKKLGRPAYTVSFTLPAGTMPFRLERKLKRVKEKRTLHRNRTISNITPIGEKECQCITVDHPDHLYITDHFVVTHNSLMGVTLLKALKPKTPALFLANSTSLVEQMYDECVKQGVPNVGVFHGKRKDPNYITCSTVQSAHLLEKVLPKFRFLLVDEIHDMMTKTTKQVLAKMSGTSMRIGMSGTPFKFGGTDPVQKFEVKGWIGPLFKSKVTESGMLTVNELQGRDILSDSFCQFLTIREPNLQYDIYQDAVQNGIAKNEHFHKVVLDLVGRCEGRTLIIVEYIAHGDRLKELYPELLWVRGQDTIDTRKDIIRQLKTNKGKTVAVATRGIFNTGIDVFVHNLINAAGGQAEHQIIQRLGRGVRRSSDKNLLYYYDFIFRNNDYLEKHSKKRLSILKKEGHRVEVHDHNDPVSLQYQNLLSQMEGRGI